MKKAFITGITGQDGSYLAEFLLDKGYLVYGLTRRTSTQNFDRIKKIVHDPHLQLVSGDLVDQNSLAFALREIQPDEIYNLAAQSFVQASWDQPVLTGEFTG
ncbi:MAG TPA: GDP-mannose 4,6-dehydratase, partial [Patescibacteria group bacterium]